MQNITMTLTLDKWNIIFNALSQRPYAEVVKLVAEMQTMAETQLMEYNKTQLDNHKNN